MSPPSARSHAALQSMPLSAGAVWRGKQASGGHTSYDVEVRICGKTDRGDLCGTLTIRNLTPSLPKLVTYFDGEVIGDHHNLVDNKWGATREDDEHHWSRFKHDLGIPGVDDLHADLPEDVIFMRLKERCILEPSQENDVGGASFEGFYYIAIKLNPSPSFSERSDDYDSMFLKQSMRGTGTARSSESLLSEALRCMSTNSHPFAPAHPISYAAIVKGLETDAACQDPSRSGIELACKADDALNTTSPSMASVLAVSPPPPYSPSLDDFPPPPHSPLAFTNFSTSYLESRRRSRSVTATPICVSKSVQRARSMTARSPLQSTNFYNAKSGYRGAWAHATMCGFYFSSSSDPYQQLELHYVGDGLGLPLQEMDEETGGGVNEYGVALPIENEVVQRREAARRIRLAQPRGFASFTML